MGWPSRLDYGSEASYCFEPARCSASALCAVGELERKEVDKMQKVDVAESAVTEWASPVVFVPKKDGKLGFCVDHRQLNAVTSRDNYRIRGMEECIDSLGETQMFSSSDANSEYWQIKMNNKDVEKTAFVIHQGVLKVHLDAV